MLFLMPPQVPVSWASGLGLAGVYRWSMSDTRRTGFSPYGPCARGEPLAFLVLVV